MATVVNNPAPSNSDSGMGFFLGIIILIIVGAIFFFYGLPYIQNGFGGGGVKVDIPKDINVNVKQSK